MQKYLYFKMILYYFKIRQSFYLICIRYKILCMWVCIYMRDRERGFSFTPPNICLGIVAKYIKLCLI